MALRVLLADESSTIKKVIQLSLQDFGVDVKSVTVGLDVLSVAKTYRPDVILADVLLAKRSGYEVCHDIKGDQETQNIPVVLMWSGFMEIDEQKARLCGADRRLEKPFDASMLRQIVQELVTRSQNNPASSFLQFPTLPPFEESKKSVSQAEITPKNIPTMKLPQIPEQQPAMNEALVIDEIEVETENADEWVQQPINPKLKEDDFTEFPLTQSPVTRQQQSAAAPPPRAPQTQSVRPSTQSASPQVPENIMREEIQKWLTTHMPDIAERLIKDEINRLLQESEKTIQGP